MPHREESQFEQSATQLPLYDQTTPGDSITLGNREILLSRNGADPIPSRAEFKIRFYPENRLEIILQHEPGFKTYLESLKEFQQNSCATMSFPSETPVVEHQLIWKSVSSDQSVFIPTSAPIYAYSGRDRIVRAVFHLFNWPRFNGPESTSMIIPVEGGHRKVPRGVFSLIIDGFLVVVNEFESTPDRIKMLDERGGSGITHVGTIRRCDGEAFDSSRLKDMLEFLTYLFSFTLGRWSGPQLTVAFDESGCRVFESLGLTSQASGSWGPSNSCFDLHHSEFFSELAGPFWRLYSDPHWRQSLPVIINWYLQANKGTSEIYVDTAILFSQAAIERICWSYCVQWAKTLRENDFKSRKMSAANRLKHLFKELSLPVELPEGTRKSLPQDLAGLDGMQLITEIRNKLVHPSGAQPLAPKTYYEVWKLSMWYIECAILRIAGYTGRYANRVSQRQAGQVESLPCINFLLVTFAFLGPMQFFVLLII